MIELKIRRKVVYSLLAICAMIGAVGVGLWLGRGPGSSVTTTTQDPPTAAVAEAPQATAAAVVTAPSGDAPAVEELTPEQDAAVQRIEVADAVAKLGDPSVVFVDTRADPEYQNGHIKGAISMPAYLMDAKLETLPKDKEIILYCA